MSIREIEVELSKHISATLIQDLLREFMNLKKDLQTHTLSRASFGKFIESVVQILEFIETGNYSTQPSVDAYLKNLESRQTSLNDDLRITAARIARATYTLRNKRNVLHKGHIDTNIYDLKLAFACAQWILTELVRQYITNDIHQAGKMVEYIQLPVLSIVESVDDRKIIHANLTVKEEILVLLHSYYPDEKSEVEIRRSIDRRSHSAIYKACKALWEEKAIHLGKSGYVLTQAGIVKAEKIMTDNS